MSLKTIRDSSRSRFLKARSINRAIQSDNFTIAYGNASADEKEIFIKAIERLDKDSIRELIKKQLQTLTPFHQMGVKQLREIGRNIRLSEYWKMGKMTLIQEIEDAVSRLKENRK